ncbi:MAG: Phosphoserine aminotransferase [Alphaproteobacteria bacterium MarineAlpha9_Bin7]|nr:MAG: Phosphoserine aminotransferase [Alphaproteobacteria bacterium MarineAlpha9_Bin7]
MKPSVCPANPNFSSGPCTKRPGWSPSVLNQALVGRSHRSAAAKQRIQDVLELSRDLLILPNDYRVAVTPASDTGAFEMAMWSMLGARGVDLLVWESFGAGWAKDIVNQLLLHDVRVFKADYGSLPDLAQVDCTRDVVFTWNGTTSGVCIPDGKWIAPDRKGLTFCDATSAAFAMPLPWDRLDVVTYSWQKVLGGEGQHGILILSPRAVERLETYTPTWPLPKIFRMTKDGVLIEGFFSGETINTPSMLCVEDILDALHWAVSIGGQEALISRSRANLAAIADWLADCSWASFLVEDPVIRSSTSVCLKIVDPWFVTLVPDEQRNAVKSMCGLLEIEGAAYDINGHRDAPPGLRLWAGATVESADLEALFPWLDWAFDDIKARYM